MPFGCIVIPALETPERAGQGPDRYRLRLQQWRELRELPSLAIVLELSEWPDGLWSVVYGVPRRGPLAVDLGNMTVGEWYRRERLLGF